MLQLRCFNFVCHALKHKVLSYERTNAHKCSSERVRKIERFTKCRLLISNSSNLHFCIAIVCHICFAYWWSLVRNLSTQGLQSINLTLDITDCRKADVLVTSNFLSIGTASTLAIAMGMASACCVTSCTLGGVWPVCNPAISCKEVIMAEKPASWPLR